MPELAYNMGFTVYVLRPSKVKKFLGGSPTKGKSDKIDGQGIASYLRTYVHQLHAYVPLPSFEKQLRMLFRKKAALTDKIASMRLLLKTLGDSPKQIEMTLRNLVQRVDALKAEISKMLELAEDAKVLFTIPAVKDNLIAAVLPILRTVPFKSKYSLDSFAGIDLKLNESGKFKGKRMMSHEGDTRLRRAVYMAGLAATSTKVWKPIYRSYLEDKKLKPIQAINALGRKILHCVYGVYKSQQPFRATTGP